ARMARLAIAAPRCGPPLTWRQRKTRRCAARPYVTHRELRAHAPDEPAVDTNIGKTTDGGVVPCVRRAVRDRAPGPRRARSSAVGGAWRGEGEACAASRTRARRAQSPAPRIANSSQCHIPGYRVRAADETASGVVTCQPAKSLPT